MLARGEALCLYPHTLKETVESSTSGLKGAASPPQVHRTSTTNTSKVPREGIYVSNLSFPTSEEAYTLLQQPNELCLLLHPSLYRSTYTRELAILS